MPPDPLTKFEIKNYYENEPRFNGVFPKNNLPRKIKDGAYTINFDEYADVGTYWIALFSNRNEIFYFDSFGVEHVPKVIKEFIDRPSSSASQKKSIKANIFRVQANDSIMCRYFCIGFINFMLAGKKLTDYTSLFSQHDFKKNDDIISKMNECNSIDAIDKTNLTNQTKFGLSEIIRIENYFHQD